MMEIYGSGPRCTIDCYYPSGDFPDLIYKPNNIDPDTVEHILSCQNLEGFMLFVFKNFFSFSVGLIPIKSSTIKKE